MKREAIKKYFHYSLILSFVFIPLFSGCAPVEIRADYLQKGFDYYNLGYSYLPESLPLNETIVLRNLKVHIVGSLKKFGRNKFRDDEKAPAVADPERRREIWVVGKKLKGKT